MLKKAQYLLTNKRSGEVVAQPQPRNGEDKKRAWIAS